MTDVTTPTGPRPGLPSDTATGLEARPALVSLVPPGGAPVCEGDVCEVPD
jgi:hypothetical protein